MKIKKKERSDIKKAYEILEKVDALIGKEAVLSEFDTTAVLATRCILAHQSIGLVLSYLPKKAWKKTFQLIKDRALEAVEEAEEDERNG